MPQPSHQTHPEKNGLQHPPTPPEYCFLSENSNGAPSCSPATSGDGKTHGVDVGEGGRRVGAQIEMVGSGAPFSAELCLKVRTDFTTHPLSLLATLSPPDAQSNHQRPGPPRSRLASPGGVTVASWIPPVLPGSLLMAPAPSTGPSLPAMMASCNFLFQRFV